MRVSKHIKKESMAARQTLQSTQRQLNHLLRKNRGGPQSGWFERQLELLKDGDLSPHEIVHLKNQLKTNKTHGQGFGVAASLETLSRIRISSPKSQGGAGTFGGFGLMDEPGMGKKRLKNTSETEAHAALRAARMGLASIIQDTLLPLADEQINALYAKSLNQFHYSLTHDVNMTRAKFDKIKGSVGRIGGKLREKESPENGVVPSEKPTAPSIKINGAEQGESEGAQLAVGKFNGMLVKLIEAAWAASHEEMYTNRHAKLLAIARDRLHSLLDGLGDQSKAAPLENVALFKEIECGILPLLELYKVKYDAMQGSLILA